MEMTSVLAMNAPDFASWSPAAWSALAAGVTVLVLIVAAGIALWQAQEARRLREEQSRPFVTIDFEVPSASLVNLVIQNVGKTVARDVTFEFDQPPTRALEKMHSQEEGTPFAESLLLTRGIPTLPPGKEINTLFDSFIHRKKEEFPDSYTVTVRYRDHASKRKFEDVYVLDIGFYRGLGFLTVKGMHELVKEVENLRKELHKWTGHGGLNVLTRNRDVHSRLTMRNMRLNESLAESSRGRIYRRLRVHLVQLADRLKL